MELNIITTKWNKDPTDLTSEVLRGINVLAQGGQQVRPAGQAATHSNGTDESASCSSDKRRRIINGRHAMLMNKGTDFIRKVVVVEFHIILEYQASNSTR